MITLKSRAGFTLTEVLVTTGLTSIVMMCTISMWIATMHSFDTTTTKSHTDSDATMAMQAIVNDVREAKSVRIVAIGSDQRLRVTFPIRTAGGYYNRSIADTAHQVDYYLSDETKVPGQKGNCLCKGKGNDRRILTRGVRSLSFYIDPLSTRTVRITVSASNDTSRGPRTTELTQRVVYLRNY